MSVKQVHKGALFRKNAEETFVYNLSKSLPIFPSCQQKFSSLINHSLTLFRNNIKCSECTVLTVTYRGIAVLNFAYINKIKK